MKEAETPAAPYTENENNGAKCNSLCEKKTDQSLQQ